MNINFKSLIILYKMKRKIIVNVRFWRSVGVLRAITPLMMFPADLIAFQTYLVEDLFRERHIGTLRLKLELLLSPQNCFTK